MDTRSLASVIGADLLRVSLLGAGAPRLVDRYILVGLLGQGASGVVVRAQDTRLDCLVALKLTLRAAATDRMLNEARALARLRRPRHVVRVMEVGGGSLALGSGAIEVAYVAMELVEGETMRTWLARADRTLEQKVTAFQCLADGVAAVHAQGIVHGDVKPDNAIMGDDGILILVDFGFAAALRADRREVKRNAIVGTGPYMAPEVRRGLVRRRSDVYALAVAMWEAVTGVHPFEPSGEPQATWYGALKELPEEGVVPKPLRKLLRSAMHPSPSRRPTSARMRDDLEAFRGTLVGGAASLLRRVGVAFVMSVVAVVLWRVRRIFGAL
jgi:serine/threonine-protein kinase